MTDVYELLAKWKKTAGSVHDMSLNTTVRIDTIRKCAEELEQALKVAAPVQIESEIAHEC